MSALLKLSRVIDRFTGWVGGWLIWLILIVTLISALNALMRYIINWSTNGLLELQWYLYSALFLGCGGYTLLHNEHVRIDILYGRLSARTRNWIDIFGYLFFFLPVCFIVIYFAVPFVGTAIDTGEYSSNAGGLIRWPVKLMLPVGTVLLLLQGISEFIKRVAYLKGVGPDVTLKKDRDAEADLADDLQKRINPK